jgi:hypothetical protein
LASRFINAVLNVPWRVEKKNNEFACQRIENLPGRELSIRYEHLRKMIGRPSRERELFVQQGLVAWMRSWAKYTTQSSTTESGTQEKSDGKCLLPAGKYLGVVNVLSGMVMGVYRSQRYDNEPADHIGGNAFLYIR